jgi:cellulose synthase/poly-beta-1,6-N-acetylglucosamine synthase-like glycosyltransferase
MIGLRDQTFKNFEIVICDNASTDGTDEICKEYAALDSRIRYHRYQPNIGANDRTRQMDALTELVFQHQYRAGPVNLY